jgi:hypothetical protein
VFRAIPGLMPSIPGTSPGIEKNVSGKGKGGLSKKE